MPRRPHDGARDASRPTTDRRSITVCQAADCPRSRALIRLTRGCLDRDAVRGHRSACAGHEIDGLVRIAQRLRPCDRQRGQRDGARADSHTAARLDESRPFSSPIMGGGVSVARAARGEGFTNTTQTEEVSK
jgi:hypothetical protein